MLANDWVAASHLFKCCSDSNYLIVAFDYYTVCRKQKRADASTDCYLHSNTTATEWVGRKYGLCQCREWRQMTQYVDSGSGPEEQEGKKGKVITDDDVTSEQSHTGKKSACSLWAQRKRKFMYSLFQNTAQSTLVFTVTATICYQLSLKKSSPHTNMKNCCQL